MQDEPPLTPPCARPLTLEGSALVLPGGGARTAYQAGVLQGLADILQQQGWPAQRNPFPVVCGTSAGAINAAHYASGVATWAETLRALPGIWNGLHADQVFHTQPHHLLRGGLRWLGLMSTGWLVRQSPRALLDNTPLADTLGRHIRLDRVDAAVQSGALRALAITASSYSTGRHITFFQGAADMPGWRRPGIWGLAQTISLDHLLASSALPFVFPAVKLWTGEQAEFCGDGAMRQLAPLAPAIRLGARCALAIGVSEPRGATAWIAPDERDYPSIAQIAGHVLSTVFLDTLPADAQLAEHINTAVLRLPPQARTLQPFREFPVLLITPSESINAIAARHWKRMPRGMRVLMGAVGAAEATGAALASYLLFEPGFCTELTQLGERDALAQADVIRRFIDIQVPAP